MFAQFSFLNHISKARCAPRPLGRGFGKRSCRQRFTISERHRECECRAFSRFGPQKLSVSERLETRRVSQLRGLLSSRVVKNGASLRGAVSVGPRHESFFRWRLLMKEVLNSCNHLMRSDVYRASPKREDGIR